jgi:hypothetical protein
MPTPATNSNFDERLSIFTENNVRYLIVGGHADMLYTEPWYTKDFDVWVRQTLKTLSECIVRSPHSVRRSLD